MEYLSIRTGHLPRRLRCIPRVEAVSLAENDRGTAFFNGPGFVLCSGREVQIEYSGRNWGVKNAGLLPLGNGVSAGISWSDRGSAGRVLSVTFSASSLIPSADGADREILALPSVITHGRSTEKQAPEVYPPLHTSLWDFHAGNLARAVEYVHTHDTDVGLHKPHGDLTDLAAFELAWSFSCPALPHRRERTAGSLPREKNLTGPGIILSIREHILQHRDEDVDYRRLAAERGLSFTTFRRHWRDIVGESPGEFLSRARMEKARYLLSATAIPIHDIAEQSGYKDQLYFSRRFRHYHGMSPREFREENHTR
ncbi:MAG: helix-turn-helix transcriptional regulator [Spirochaetales bacterium]|nr:helix-turn-helix transcriptional regulator [Spirochaetales bacterium]